MICPECNGSGEAIYYVETDRDENTVTVEKRKCICRTCIGSGKKPQTNADRIRAMSDEELAEFIRDVSYECQDASWSCHCQTCSYPWCSSDQTVEWLKQPAEE